MTANQFIYEIKDLDPSIHYEEYTFNKDDFGLIDYTELPGEIPYIPVAFKGDDGKWYKITSIGYMTFYCCHNLKNIIIPDSVTSIDGSTFIYCSELTDVVIGNGVTNIGSNTFRGCTNLKSITIPDSVTSISPYTFGDCTNLTCVFARKQSMIADEVKDESQKDMLSYILLYCLPPRGMFMNFIKSENVIL